MIRVKTVTLTGVGADGSAAASETLSLGRGGFIRALSIDFGAGEAATADLTVRADSSTGAVLFTSTNSATDQAAAPVAMAGIDEARAATAATDVGSGGFPFATGVYVAIAQGDSGEVTTVKLWLEV